MNTRTDLTIELAETVGTQDGISSETRTVDGVTITRTVITDEAASKAVGKPQGEYYTLEMLPFSDAAFEPESCFEAASDILRELLPRHGGILAAGLGNTAITPDALGSKAASRILATRHISGELAEKCGLAPLRPTTVIAPGVLGQTGIEAAEYLQCLCAGLHPAAVIVIDAMAARSLSRLGRTIQISDSGISPGAGVGNNRPCIDSAFLGTRVVSLGVPTVVDLRTLSDDLCGGNCPKTIGENLIVTPREIDLLTDRAARFIAMTVNAALQPHLHPDEIAKLF
ncbi:MAG: GPR endopeptidase [Clostridia bacterium]|nr:GPR endopeptidase [Clostridia bacterium]